MRNHMRKLFKQAICLLAIMCLVACGKSQLNEQLELGQKYLEELDYEDALSAFLSAIEIDNKNVEAYIGAADSYIGLEDYENAVSILEKGYKETSDKTIARKLDEVKASIEKQSTLINSDNAETVGDDISEDIENQQEENEEVSISSAYNAFADYLVNESNLDCEYLPCYFDEDEIPDILYMKPDDFFGEIHVLKIVNNEVVDIGAINGGNIIEYLPERGIIRNQIMATMDTYQDEYYHIDNNGKLSLMASSWKYYEHGIHLDETPDEEYYYLGSNEDNEVTKEEFSTYVNSFDNDLDNPYITVQDLTSQFAVDFFKPVTAESMEELRERDW
ncbi:hypothetical protein CIY_34320 [Butyrivibrio fibrisolvens 16/4]|nr:hypothetical protein CIY_34320 [Butyrivibrio fibrisolvens 16/4]